MKTILMPLSTLLLFPVAALAAPATGLWEACSSMMSGMGWMMLPMMIMPLLLITLLVLGVLALIKCLKN